MSLLSIDIRKAKRLSLQEVKLPAPELRPPEPTQAPEAYHTAEEIAYSRLLAINPLAKDLVERLGLVSCKTSKELRGVAPEETPTKDPVDRDKLTALAIKALDKERSYTKEEIITRLREETRASQERAGKGFKLMLEAGAIEPTLGESYYLKGSTPF